MTRISLGLTAVLVSVSAARAEDQAAEHVATVGKHDEHPHAHHLALFLGATTTAHETAPSVGADYFFYLPVLDRRLGVGPLVDASFGQHLTEIVIGLALAAKGPIGLQLALAPIVVLVEDEKHWGGRVNLTYGFHLGPMFSVGPSVSADLLAHDASYVYGLNAGIGL